jgi:hypothetical protein
LAAPQASAPPPQQPQKQTVTRLVPTGIRRALSFVTPLNPDCSSPGSVEYRLTQPPEHGTAEMTQEEDYPRLLPNHPAYSCMSKKVPGLKISFTSENGYLGNDRFAVLLLFPDGTASEWQYDIMVR